MSIEKVLYRAHAHATGGCDGRAVVPEGKLDFKLTTPKELGGAGGAGGEGGAVAQQHCAAAVNR